LAQEYSQIALSEPKPFVKWAGGKRQLMPELEKNFPTKFGTYVEPFLGGGAVMFDLLTKESNLKCNVSDLNSDLVLAYVTIRDRLEKLIESLENHSKNYHKDSTGYYYEVRNQEPKNQIEKVSRLLFLNKTCFNGLYRVNSKGKFNVPLGRYTNPNIVNKENLQIVSKTLQSAKIKISCRDFGSIVKDAKKGDFVYFDPPYQPISDTANFTSYTHRDFTEDDLERLADLANQLNSKGCKVMLSNSNSKTVKKLFSSGWAIKEIKANRSINSNSQKRTGHKEIIIKNY
jgi:DNA adenine methylase